MSEKSVVAVIVEGPSDENAIGGILKEYFSSDEVIHIADTDGAFTTGCVQETETENIQYYEDYMKSSNVEATERRNKHKAAIMFKLYSTGKVHDIRYRLYFNSCNLEHVLYNELKDFSNEEKEILSDDFADKYEGDLQGFLDFISDTSLAVSGTYKQTWKFIEKDKNSLHSVC